ncbi:hypothetical protein DAEQUDRAFT_315626 [Daedalea quercina L-15889]|uniref:Uncharacterized protein n=1 Tax=Daedalea quercina L-15889 TaxID=1314783 RepID=A0A165PW41_9APHY|nr:hypothetical protein DAEQUDRAFT_315626 [Daedalea quercina L-15889]
MSKGKRCNPYVYTKGYSRSTIACGCPCVCGYAPRSRCQLQLAASPRSRSSCSRYSCTRRRISTRCSCPNSRASRRACARFAAAARCRWSARPSPNRVGAIAMPTACRDDTVIPWRKVGQQCNSRRPRSQRSQRPLTSSRPPLRLPQGTQA